MSTNEPTNKLKKLHTVYKTKPNMLILDFVERCLVCCVLNVGFLRSAGEAYLQMPVVTSEANT